MLGDSERKRSWPMARNLGPHPVHEMVVEEATGRRRYHDREGNLLRVEDPLPNVGEGFDPGQSVAFEDPLHGRGMVTGVVERVAGPSGWLLVRRDDNGMQNKVHPSALQKIYPDPTAGSVLDNRLAAFAERGKGVR